MEGLLAVEEAEVEGLIACQHLVRMHVHGPETYLLLLHQALVVEVVEAEERALCDRGVKSRGRVVCRLVSRTCGRQIKGQWTSLKMM